MTAQPLIDTGAPALQPRLRPVRGDDLPAMRQFVQTLGGQTRSLRFHGGVNPSSPRLLQHLVGADGQRHIAWVAVLPCDDGDLIVGEARCIRGRDGEPAEFAICVADAWQGRGLARALLHALLAAAAEAGVTWVAGDVLVRNDRMAGFMRRAGFEPAAAPEAGVQRWACRLAQGRPAHAHAAKPGALGAGRGALAAWGARVVALFGGRAPGVVGVAGVARGRLALGNPVRT